MEVSVTRRNGRNPKLRTACDRCYQLKERCERTTTSVLCARCERLGLDCATIRPVRPVGRRVKHENQVSKLASGKRRKLQHHQHDIDSIDACLDNPEEKELLQFLLGQTDSMDNYVVCPSFQAEQQHSLAAQLPTALPLLKDAYLACAITIKQLQSDNVADTDANSSIRYITKAMSALHSLSTSCSENAILCQTLGSMLAFSIYSVIGVGVPEICKYCLDTANPSVETGTTISRTNKGSWESFLVLLETMDCLVHRQKPTVRIQTPASGVVDRHLGLCLPLMPYYYDLCVINNSLAHSTDLAASALLQKQLNDIQSVVESWQPSNMDQLVGQFDSTEIAHLLAQAKVYRLGALLVGHRLRYRLGEEDSQAAIWSKEIIMELEMAYQVTKRCVRFVTLPFIVAAVEVRDKTSRSKTLKLVDDCVDQYAPTLKKATKKFLCNVWRERDSNFTGYCARFLRQGSLW
uniref:Transcription factor ACEII n=1 Tax=Talaromyces marneffei PM1 TaxID=1077442 RepID=A0A093V390_TALMA